MKKILLLLSFFALIVVRFVADFLPFSGGSTIEIVNRLPILIMPAAYTFFLRFIMFLLLGFWLWDIIRRNTHMTTRMTAYFVLSNLSNILFVFNWHSTHYTAALIWSGFTFLFAFLLYLACNKYPTQFLRFPISVLVGWSLLMLLFNTKYVLTLVGWSGFGISSPLWAIISLTIAASIALYFLYQYEDIAIVFVFIWTYVGIVIRNGFDEPFVTLSTLFLIFILGLSVFSLMQTTHQHEAS